MRRGRPPKSLTEHQAELASLREVLRAHAPRLGPSDLRHYERKIGYRVRRIRQLGASR